MAPGATIEPIDVALGDKSDATEIAAALDRAGQSGARVVNASLATDPMDPGHRETSNTAHAMALAFSAHPNTLYVAAAGQDHGNDNDEHPVYPCSSDAPNLICVGGYEVFFGSDTAYGATNHGAESVDLLAPAGSHLDHEQPGRLRLRRCRPGRRCRRPTSPPRRRCCSPRFRRSRSPRRST